jgi:CheY-like chemotaxis protein
MAVSFTLLVVEDNPMEIGLLDLMLKRNFPEWIYHFVYNGEELLDFLSRQTQVSLLLLDIDLPGKDGIALLSEIRADPSYQTLPVVGYSSSTSRATRNTFIGKGANAFFVKPTESEQIIALFKKLPAFARTTKGS